MSLFSIITIASGIGCLVMLAMWRLEANMASPNGEEIGDRAKEIGRRLREGLEKKARSARKFGTGFAVAALCYVLMNKLNFWIVPQQLFLPGVFSVSGCWLLVKLWQSRDDIPTFIELIIEFLYRWLMNCGSLTRTIDDIVDPLTQEEVRKRVEKSDRAALVFWKSRSKITDELMTESANLRRAAKRKFRNSLVGTVSMVLLSSLMLIIC